MFKEKERKRKVNVHVTEARASVCNLVVGKEGKEGKKAKSVTSMKQMLMLKKSILVSGLWLGQHYLCLTPFQ